MRKVLCRTRYQQGKIASIIYYLIQRSWIDNKPLAIPDPPCSPTSKDYEHKLWAPQPGILTIKKTSKNERLIPLGTRAFLHELHHIHHQVPPYTKFHLAYFWKFKLESGSPPTSKSNYLCKLVVACISCCVTTMKGSQLCARTATPYSTKGEINIRPSLQ